MDPRIQASRKQERALAKSVEGHTTVRSGAGWAVKNDVRNAQWSFEAKTTTRGSFTLTAAALALAERNAVLDGRESAFVIEMAGRTWVVLSLEQYTTLTSEGA